FQYHFDVTGALVHSQFLVLSCARTTLSIWPLCRPSLVLYYLILHTPPSSPPCAVRPARSAQHHAVSSSAPSIDGVDGQVPRSGAVSGSAAGLGPRPFT